MKYTVLYLDPFHYSGRAVCSLPFCSVFIPLVLNWDHSSYIKIIYKEF